jgi:uncharacterized protein YbjT (DUF2867 family)
MTAPATYTVTAATGHIGRRVALGLLAAGHTVRAVGRDAARLRPLVERGAVPLVGDVRDATFVERCLTGADAAFLVVPPERGERDFRRYFGDVGRVYAEAARRTGLPAALFVSCVGAHDEKHRGLVLVHADVEQILDAVPGLATVHLRAPSFFENLFYFLPAMRARGALASPILPDAPYETVGTQDIAAAAVRLLLGARDFHGHRAVEIHGVDGLTMRAIAAAIGRALGRPFPVEHVARDADVEALVGVGASRDFATLINDTWDLFGKYGVLRGTAPTAASRAPTPIEDFIRDELVPVLRG